MVLIECFTPRHIENISTCLRLKPQKLVMIGKGEEMEEPLKRYRSLLEVDGKKYFNDCMMGVQLVPNAAEKDHDWRRMFLRTEEEEQ